MAGPARELAKTGDAEAQSLLGLMLLEGQGVERSASEGKVWLQKASDQGYLPATGSLIHTLEREQTVDEARLFGLRLQLASAGDGRSTDHQASVQVQAVATAYLLRIGTSQDDVKAREWLARAITRERPRSRDVIRYATLLFEGKGGSPDRVEAERLVRMHAREDVVVAEFLADLILERVVAGTDAEAHELLQRGAKTRAAWALALIHGDAGVTKDPAAGIAILEASANLQGYESAPDKLNALAFLLWRGEALPRDRKRATTLWQRAAKEGHTEALFHLGALHFYKLFKDASPVSAQVYFELAALEKRQPEGEASIDAKKRADEHRAKLSEAERVEVNARVARERIRLLW